jgi:hypothetical protein
MSVFSAAELDYLGGDRRLARVATVGKDGTPHVVPVGFRYNAEHDSIDIDGHDFGPRNTAMSSATGEPRLSWTTSRAPTPGGLAGSKSGAVPRRSTGTAP